MDYILPILFVVVVLFVTFVAFAKRYRRCPSDRILVVYGKIGGGGPGTGMSAKCYHGGAAFIWPLFQDYAFLDLTPLTIDIKLEGALSLQNIRVNTPSTFTVGISTDPGVMENAAERLLGMDLKEVSALARDIIFGQMRVVLATMPIEEINADRDKLIENITSGVEGELKKVGLRLINVNIQDITDESGYIDALGQEAAARAINEAKVKVAQKVRDGAIGSADAERDQRVRVADAQATAVEGENEAAVKVAQSNAVRREKEAEAERSATAAEKVKSAQALEESYAAEEEAERQRAKREEATQAANVLVPAEIKKREMETLAEAEAEQTRRTKQGEADGLRSVMEAEAAGLEAILSRKAQGFDRMVAAAHGSPELAALLLVTEQLPELVAEQVKAISNLKIDTVTVWDGGRGSSGDGTGGGRTATADFLSGLVGSLPPLHELTRNVGVELPEYLGRLEREGGSGDPGDGGESGRGSGDGGAAGGGRGEAAEGGEGGGRTRASGRERRSAPQAEGAGDEDEDAEAPRSASGGGAAAGDGEAAEPHREEVTSERGEGEVEGETEAAESVETAGRAEAAEVEAAAQAAPPPPSPDLRRRVRSRLAELPHILRQLDLDRDGRTEIEEVEEVVDAVFDWAAHTADEGTAWYFAEGGQPVGPAGWRDVSERGEARPDLLVNRDRSRFWLPYALVADAANALGARR